MQRQITFYKFEVGVKSFEQDADNPDFYRLVRRPVTEVEATAMTKTEARRAIIDSGVECPRGTEVYWSKVGRVRYKFDNQRLLDICDSREELPLD